MKKQLAVLAVMGFVALSSTAHASLVVSGTGTMAGVAGSYQLIYDADLDITWLDYTKSYATWNTQMAWTANLAVTVNGVTYDNWRLPSAGPNPAPSYNQTTSEMGHLYYTELGNTAGSGLANTGVFKNLVSFYYWSGTEYAADQYYAWYFRTDRGGQYVGGKNQYGGYHALAVLPGQIQSVPEPASMLLTGSGLAGLVGQARKKRAH